MDEPFYYPPLDEATVKNLDVVRQLAADHASYFLSSPYSGKIEEFLKKWFPQGKAIQPALPDEDSIDLTVPEGRDRWEMLYRESHELYVNLKAAGTGMIEVSEKNAYYRTAVALLEKLIALQERALNLKQISDFHQTVLDILEGVLTPNQRNEVMERLSNAISGGR